MFSIRKEKSKVKIAEEIKKRILDDGKEVFRRYNLEKVHLFGPMFDLKIGDTAEVAALAIPLNKDEFWSFRQELGVLIGSPVDVFDQNDATEFLKKIQERGELIFSEY